MEISRRNKKMMILGFIAGLIGGSGFFVLSLIGAPDIAAFLLIVLLVLYLHWKIKINVYFLIVFILTFLSVVAILSYIFLEPEFPRLPFQ